MRLRSQGDNTIINTPAAIGMAVNIIKKPDKPMLALMDSPKGGKIAKGTGKRSFPSVAKASTPDGQPICFPW